LCHEYDAFNGKQKPNILTDPHQKRGASNNWCIETPQSIVLQQQNRDRFARALLSETLSGNVMLRDAGSLLGVKPDKIENLAKEFNI